MRLDGAKQLINSLPASKAQAVVRIVIHQPGGVGGTPAVDVKAIHSGIDWDGNTILIYPDGNLSLLSRQEVEDIQKSVSMGQSWHSYQKFKQYKQELSEAKSEIAKLKHDGYQSGAVSALSYIAMAGASIQDLVDTMEVMGVMLDAHTDTSDMERFVNAYGADALRLAGILE